MTDVRCCLSAGSSVRENAGKTVFLSVTKTVCFTGQLYSNLAKFLPWGKMACSFEFYFSVFQSYQGFHGTRR